MLGREPGHPPDHGFGEAVRAAGGVHPGKIGGQGWPGAAGGGRRRPRTEGPGICCVTGA
jgi:hypothetical protein